MKSIYLFLFVFSCCFPAIASWYQVEGSADIQQGVPQARQKAIKNAMTQIELYSGIRISGTLNVIDGKLVSDDFAMTPEQQSALRDVQLVSEKRKGDRLTVVLRANVLHALACREKNSVINRIAIAQLRLKNRHQAAYGGIYSLDQTATERLYQLLSQNQQLATKLIKQPIGFTPDTLYSNPATGSLIRDLSDKSQSRYILLGYIDDLSVDSKQATPGWKLWQSHSVPRNLGMQLYLLDGLTGDILSQQRYQGRASWTEKPNQLLDPNSKQFWRSEYGKAWQHQLTQAATDVAGQLNCQPAITQIVATHDGNYVIPLGRLDGVRNGQIAHLSRRQQFIDTLGQINTLFETSQVALKVTTAGPHQAVLTPVEPSIAGNIQVQDAVIF